MKKVFFKGLLAACMCSLPLLISAQDERKAGLTASLQGQQLGIMVPVWLGSNFTLAPALDFVYSQNIGSDLAIALVPRYYFKTEGISPFVSAKLGAAFSFPAEENDVQEPTSRDYLGGLGFGAEYFFNPHFSAGVEAQANLTKSGENSYRFGNPGAVNFNTATAASFSIYF